MDRRARVRYTILEEIGLDSKGRRRGQNSIVYRAHDPQLGGEIAVKEIEKSSFPDPDSYFGEAHRMFEVHSEHVVPVQYMCERGSKVCLAMRYFKKKSLADRIERGPLGLAETVTVGLGILKGLSQIHPDTFHFDIKPSNVLFSDKNVPMVADFGQARTVQADGTVLMPRMYRLCVPPEWFKSGVGTAASDIYQVGMTLYRAVNGEPFFDDTIPAIGLGEAIKNGKFPKRDEFLPHVPKRLRTIIRTAMNIDPKLRYKTPHDFQNALGFALKHDWTVNRSPQTDELTWRSKPKGLAEMQVQLRSGGPTWSVEVHKIGKTRLRFGEKAHWKSGLTREDALEHLQGVFAEL